MDNVTHALVGVSLAELALGRSSSAPAQTRRVFMVAAVVAASAPDIDLVYTGLTAAPLGYLLHHRGHSHTWPGLLALGLLMWAALRYWPSARVVLAAHRRRLVWLLGASLGSHLVLDALNVYGTHLLYPLTNRWYYGDAVFIFEPWIWILLGVSAAINCQRALTRWIVVTSTAGLPLLLAVFGLVTWLTLVMLALGGVLLERLFRRTTHAAIRSAVAVGASSVVFAGMLGASFIVKAQAREALQAFGHGTVVDIASNPNPAVPWCWTVMGVTYDFEREEIVTRRGTLSLLPALAPPDTCVSHRLMDDARTMRLGDRGRVVWNGEWRGDAGEMRALYRQDCWARSWFQFGRLPFLDDDRLVDLRFENPIGTNFSSMAVGGVRERDGCPSNLTNWEPPRIDVLDR